MLDHGANSNPQKVLAAERCQHRLGNLHTAVRAELRSNEVLIGAYLSSISLSSPGHKKNSALPLHVLLAPPSPSFQKFHFTAQSTISRRIDELDLVFNVSKLVNC